MLIFNFYILNTENEDKYFYELDPDYEIDALRYQQEYYKSKNLYPLQSSQSKSSYYDQINEHPLPNVYGNKEEYANTYAQYDEETEHPLLTIPTESDETKIAQKRNQNKKPNHDKAVNKNRKKSGKLDWSKYDDIVNNKTYIVINDVDHYGESNLIHSKDYQEKFVIDINRNQNQNKIDQTPQDYPKNRYEPIDIDTTQNESEPEETQNKYENASLFPEDKSNLPSDPAAKNKSITKDGIITIFNIPYSYLKAVSMSMYGNHKCIINTSGALMCWLETKSNSDINYNDITIHTPVGFEAGTTQVSVGPVLTCAVNGRGVQCWNTDQQEERKYFLRAVTVSKDVPVEKVVYVSSKGNCKGQYVCMYAHSNKCFKYDRITNTLNEPVYLPEELNYAKNIDANKNMVSGIMKDGKLFSLNRNIRLYNKLINYVRKFASNKERLCAISKDQMLMCYTNLLKPMELHTEMKVKVYDVSMSENYVCVAASSYIVCWDFYYSVKYHFLNYNVKQLANSDGSVCVIQPNSALTCEESQLGKFKTVVPQDIQHDAVQVKAGVNSTAAINKKGQLKFWWNYPKYHPNSIHTFEGMATRSCKFTLSKQYLCSINDKKELDCYRILPLDTRLASLPVPYFLKKGALDVSAGKQQICAVSAQSAVVCWKYVPGEFNKFQLTFVPKPLFLKSNARMVSTSYNKHCGVDSRSMLTCWGLHKFDYSDRMAERRYMQVIQEPVRSVDAGYEYFCYILKKGELKCFNIKENKVVDVPVGFSTGTKQVSVGLQEVCAISKEDSLKCWDYTSGVTEIPAAIDMSAIIDVSAGQQQNCAVTKEGYLSCWPVQLKY